MRTAASLSTIPRDEEPSLPGATAARASLPSRHTLAVWLATASRMVPDVRAAYVRVGDGQRPAAAEEAGWPQGAVIESDLRHLAAEILAGDEAHRITSAGPGMIYLARRLACGQGAQGALVLRLPQPPAAQRELLFRLVDWAEAWFRLRDPSAHDAGVAFDAVRQDAGMRLRVAVVERGLAAASVAEAAKAMAIAFAAAARADQASVGLLRDGLVKLLACSHTAALDPQSGRNRALAAAMDEAIDAGQPLILVARDARRSIATQAHEVFCSQERAASICTLLLADATSTLGAISLVRQQGEPFSAQELDALVPAAASVASLLRFRLAAEAPLMSRLRASAKRRYREAGRGGRALAAALVLACAALLCLTGTYRVSAPAVLHGSIQRSLVAPIDGYVAEASARAGDAVKAGALMAVIDTRALEFERRKWVAERAEAEKTLRQAVAGLNRAEAAINKARVGQTSAQLALLDEQIARARLTAPFDGMVISGDLSRDMGAPVSRGQVLFELAPLDDYRVEIDVDERDIAAIVPGQQGSLGLTAVPGERLGLRVEKVLGVATAQEGHNVFKVEARLLGDVTHLRPGMHGVARIDAGARPLWWVGTHALVDRVRLWLWSRTP